MTTQLNDFWTDGDTGVALLPEPHPCGHTAREQGCGGCDPGAGFVIDAAGVVQLAPGETDAMILDDPVGDLIGRLRIDEWTNAPSSTLAVGVDAINQGRRHVMPRTLTLG